MIRLKRLGYTEYGNESVVSTIEAADGAKPYETAVLDPHYNGSFIVVEDYDTEKDALDGHERWVNTMVTNPPDKLVEVLNGFYGYFKELGEISYDRKTI